MTGSKRWFGVGLVGCVLAGAALAACRLPANPGDRSGAPLTGSDVEVPTCIDCVCENECTAQTAWMCPSGQCNAAGTCACDPGYADTDCPSTGCCDAVIDIDGEPMVDAGGGPVYQCVTPTCATDDDCGNGERCLAGESCGHASCGCPYGEGPDPEEPCCLAVNSMGVCCTSGEVDDAGRCVCSDPRMTDDGHDCQCPAEMVPDDQGTCVCEDPHAAFDPEVGSCACAEGYWLDTDPYTGEATCVADGDPPDACPDPHAVIDAQTGDCECQPGFVLGDTLETASAQCVPVTCGDGVCGDGETCALCSYDCGSCSGGGPDAGVPDAGIPDARPDAWPEGGLPDAGVPDGATPPEDAALPPHDAVVCVPTSFTRCQVDPRPD